MRKNKTFLISGTIIITLILLFQTYLGLDFISSKKFQSNIACASDPGVQTNPATNILTSQAALQGNITSLGGANSVYIWFQWGTTSSYGNETARIFRSTIGNFTRIITNLSPNTVYHFRAVIENNQNTVYGENRTFTTSSIPPSNNPPTANAGPDRQVLENQSITLLGSGSDPNGDPITFYWSCDMGALSNNQISQPTYTAPSVNQNTSYVCTLTVADNKGLSAFDILNVRVLNQASGLGVQTNPATNILTNQATLQGNITSLREANSVYVWFQWGTTSSYGNETARIFRSTIGNFTRIITNLSPNTVYHFRAVIENNQNTVYGENRTFTTSSIPQSNNPPTANAGPDRQVLENQSITLLGSGSDPNGDPINYYWSCNGGYLSNSNISQPSWTAPNVSQDTSYTCALTVTDSRGASSSDSMIVYIGNYYTYVPTNPTIGSKFNIEVLARNLSAGQANWLNVVSANPLDVLAFRIVVEATGASEARDVIVKHTLPSNIIYKGNLKINDVPDSRDITAGVNIGNLMPLQVKIITYEVQAASKENFGYGTTNLLTTITASNLESFNSATSRILVARTEVAGAATAVPTGLTNNLFIDSFILPLVISFLLIWLVKSRLIDFEKWLDLGKERHQRYRAEKDLKLKVAKIKKKERILI